MHLTMEKSENLRPFLFFAPFANPFWSAVRRIPAEPRYFWTNPNAIVSSRSGCALVKTLRLPRSGPFERKSAGPLHWAEILGISAGPMADLGDGEWDGTA